MMDEKERTYIRGTVLHATGTQVLNKTGGRRVFTPVVDHPKCISCKICSQFCPDGCIERLVVDKTAPPSTPRIIIDMDYCKGCGICAHECPTKAIEMVYEV